jgi:hypothetical protein
VSAVWDAIWNPCALCSCRPSQSERAATNEYGVRYVRGEHLCVCLCRLLCPAKKPHMQQQPPVRLPRRRTRSTCKVSTFASFVLVLLLFFIVLVAPLCAQVSGTARQKLKEGMKTLLASVFCDCFAGAKKRRFFLTRRHFFN